MTPSLADGGSTGLLAGRVVQGVLILWAAVNLCWLVLAIGRYESRIEIVTHGNVDVLPAWLAYELLEELTSRRAAFAVADGRLLLPALALAAAVVAWFQLVRRSEPPSLPGGGPASTRAWWVGVLVALLLHLAGWLLGELTADGGAYEGTVLDTRLIAYPLWCAIAAAVVITAVRGFRLARRAAASTEELAAG